MDLTPLNKWKKPELLAELALYRANPLDGVEVAAEETITNMAKAVAEITRLREVAGYPHTVTQEDIDLNPDGELTLDEVVFLSQAEVDEKTRAEGEAAAAAKLAKGGADASEEATASSKELVYKGRTVIRHSTRVAHGRSYIDVDLSTEVVTMSPEEFARDVKPRG